MKSDEKFIKRCIKLSEQSLNMGELPFASIIVRNGKIIAQSKNRTKIDNDLTHHAEIIVIKSAQKVLSSTDLSRCTIYSSTEPCPMCSFMIRESKFKKVVFSVQSPIMGGYSKFKILQDPNLEKLSNFFNKPPVVLAGLLEEEAGKIWGKWREQAS